MRGRKVKVLVTLIKPAPRQFKCTLWTCLLPNKMPAGRNKDTLMWVLVYILVFICLLFGLKLLTYHYQNKQNKDKKRSRKKMQSEYRSNENISENNNSELNDDITILDNDYSISVTDADVSILDSPNINNPLQEIRNILMEPTKGRSKGERICREIFQEIYGLPFPSTYPDFLRNPQTNRLLELDGYNEQLKIAFEYNGRQHYKKVRRFHPHGNTDLLYQFQKDDFKIRKCDENGVYLIIIPDEREVPHKKLRDYIEFMLPEAVAHREKLKRMGHSVPNTYKEFRA